MAPKRTCECGACQKCKRREYMNAYYRRPGEAERIRSRVMRYREINIETIREKDRKRGYRGRPEAMRAHNAARVLKRQPCEVCGAERVEAHHPDYSKPLEVVWLCKRHHMEVHRLVA